MNHSPDQAYSAPETKTVYLAGNVYGNNRFVDGELVSTSSVMRVEKTQSQEVLRCYTKNSCYELASFLIDKDYKFAYPDAFTKLAESAT